MQMPVRLDEGLVGTGKDHARSAQRQCDDAFLDRADAHGLGRLVAAAAHDGHAGGQACCIRCLYALAFP
jgi:hypothetical protein